MDRWGGRCRRDLLRATVPIVLVLGSTGPVAAAEWAVKTIARGDGPGTRCVLESARQSLWDGYQSTTAHLTVDRQSVAVTSVSNLDAGFPDVGLSVDRGAFVPIDRLAGPKTAVFDSKHTRIVERFKAGARVQVQLRFWPEWPATGPHSATFSLIGFSKAYDALASCP